MDYTEQLFSYGTLRYEPVQMSTFGRVLQGKADILLGFALTMVQINDADVVAVSGEAHHPILSYTGNDEDKIEGMVFLVNSEELLQADSYEVSDYKRVFAKLASGAGAWVYVSQASPSPT